MIFYFYQVRTFWATTIYYYHYFIKTQIYFNLKKDSDNGRHLNLVNMSLWEFISLSLFFFFFCILLVSGENWFTDAYLCSHPCDLTLSNLSVGRPSTEGQWGPSIIEKAGLEGWVRITEAELGPGSSPLFLVSWVTWGITSQAHTHQRRPDS